MPKKVLLVDDEEQFVEVLAERLETRGFVVETSFSGDDALEKLQQSDVDVIVLDVLMAGKDGLTTLREIKKLKPLTEVIMLTGQGSFDTAIQGMKLGAYDFLMKPTETEDLVSKIKRACGRKAEHEERILRAESDEIVNAQDR